MANVWDIDNKYFIKKYDSKIRLCESAALSDLLIQHNIKTARFIRTPGGEPYIETNGEYYCFMEKLKGGYFNPYNGNPYENGVFLGTIVAELHAALKVIGENFECYDADYIQELNDWIMVRVNEHNLSIPQEIIDYCYSIESFYKTLPRQLIHRDLHLGNMLFDNGNFTGFIDLDNSQKNARLHDICYFGVMLLTNKHENADNVAKWREIFKGILMGYQKKFVLTENELKALPHIFVMVELTFAAFFAQIGNFDIAKSCAEFTTWLYDNRIALLE
jgi:Ser/Thr protein kinase RdoA (MazF antagonist)